MTKDNYQYFIYAWFVAWLIVGIIIEWPNLEKYRVGRMAGQVAGWYILGGMVYGLGFVLHAVFWKKPVPPIPPPPKIEQRKLTNTASGITWNTNGIMSGRITDPIVESLDITGPASNTYFVQFDFCPVIFKVKAHNRVNSILRIPGTVWEEKDWTNGPASLRKIIEVESRGLRIRE